MILRKMLQRLYASLITGPGLNARPHYSRQRIDLMELRHLGSTDPSWTLRELLGPPSRRVEFAAKVPFFDPPHTPENEWSEEQKAHRAAFDRQSRVLTKLRDITEDATDYYNDHGEPALFIGFPLLSMPPVQDRDGFRSGRILAPLVLAPVILRVRRGVHPGLTIETSGEGADLVQPNPSLLAWIEQQTGTSTESFFADEVGEEPWREIAEMIALTSKSAGLSEPFSFEPGTNLIPVPRTDELPPGPTLLPCAVLGLFPLVNPGLLRDTQWMIENEESLEDPVRAFLRPEALAEPPADRPLPEVQISSASSGSEPAAESGPQHDFYDQLLITQADPCQIEAVSHARRSKAVVIHGPPGTGKSQTIANIIGDHLARRERVLFVCDKRTALDVVKYRLDSMGLGSLCGVIHDPQRDRRDLYLQIRDRLEYLAQDPPNPDLSGRIHAVNNRLSQLYTELRTYFDSLHLGDSDGRPFHELCGEWFQLWVDGAARLPELDGFTSDLLRAHRADAEEVLSRAAHARWPTNPFRERLALSLEDWLAADPNVFREKLERAAAIAEALDQTLGNQVIPLDPAIPAAEQSSARRLLADQLEAVLNRRLERVAVSIIRRDDWTSIQSEMESLTPHAERLDQPLDREIMLQLSGEPPSPAECAQALIALDLWAELQHTWTRFLTLRAKREATAALRRLGLSRTPENVDRAREFYKGLRSRYLYSDFYDRLTARLSKALLPDERLRAFRDGMQELIALRQTMEHPANLVCRERVREALAQREQPATDILHALRSSAERAAILHELEEALQSSGLFLPSALVELSAGWRANEPAGPICREFVEHLPTLEEAVRLVDRIQTLPEPLRLALDAAALAGFDWPRAESALRATALTAEIRSRLLKNPSLGRLDTKRVEAAFAELAKTAEEKSELVRAQILHLWQTVWRGRLLAGTGTRLNSLGASLRQRLFVRGHRAMKLRQMIAAGARIEGGDPLFDLCPVWMASPATVSQVFPREPIFDVIIFDEASQCRLEEALPALLRARRVVIAGDPKQLPPTRFFEQAIAESDAVAAETPEELFAQQQAEAEDLLSAALNLNMQESFLDVHYRSRNEALIGFSNHAFYSGRLQPIPGHPRQKAAQTPIRLVRVDGVYRERGNEEEARGVARLVAELLDRPNPPSIGVACFNLNQRDLIMDALEELAVQDPLFAKRLESARKQRGRDSFEGLFVKNLENVQGDERDHIIISTTFGPDPEGRFRRNFGALSTAGGERRLNVLVTRARQTVHVLTSVPRSEYIGAAAGSGPETGEPGRPKGRQLFYAYLRYAEEVSARYEEWKREQEAAQAEGRGREMRAPACTAAPTSQPSPVAEALGRRLLQEHEIAAQLYWGNDGFCVDVALVHPESPSDVTLGVLVDFTRYPKTPDPIAWEQFRSSVLLSQGWKLHRVWTPALFRDPEAHLIAIQRRHWEAAGMPAEQSSSSPNTAETTLSGATPAPQ